MFSSNMFFCAGWVPCRFKVELKIPKWSGFSNHIQWILSNSLRRIQNIVFYQWDLMSSSFWLVKYPYEVRFSLLLQEPQAVQAPKAVDTELPSESEDSKRGWHELGGPVPKKCKNMERWWKKTEISY
jgi:hypothetical protein